MEKKEKKNIMSKLKDYYWLVATIFIIVCGFFSAMWSLFNKYQEMLDKNEETLITIKTTQQMSLKSVIWNEGIPEIERISACDVYIAAGYNSATKKHCETIIERSDY